MTAPVLVVADNAAISRFAVRWAGEFARTGRLHRVRLVGAGGESEIGAVVAEARSLRAATIVAAGGDTACRVAAAVAARLDLALVRHEAGDETVG